MFTIYYRKVFLAIAALIMVASIGILLSFGLKLGIDFISGSLLEVTYTETIPDKSEVEEALTGLSFDDFSVRDSTFDEGASGFLIRTRDLSEAERQSVSTALTNLGAGGEITRFTSVGPTIGKELKDKAIWAVVGVSLVITLYVAFAFAGIGYPVSSWVYALITIFILIHDVLVPTALVSLLGHLIGLEADVLFIMALLAVLGYSVNDTIVIFDRVRENLIASRLEKRSKSSVAGTIKEEVTYKLTKPYEEIMGSAVTQSMGRSINTSLTTLITLVALYFIGGSATQTFALVLIAGVVAGTYSSICVATPLLVTYARWQESKGKSS